MPPTTGSRGMADWKEPRGYGVVWCQKAAIDPWQRYCPWREGAGISSHSCSIDISSKALLEQYENFANINIELSTKNEQLEASATTNACTINDEQLVKKNKKLKEKLASSQNDYQSLLAKLEIMCKHCDELTNKVANLEAVNKTSTKASKRNKIIKKDVSTS